MEIRKEKNRFTRLDSPKRILFFRKISGYSRHDDVRGDDRRGAYDDYRVCD